MMQYRILGTDLYQQNTEKEIKTLDEQIATMRMSEVFGGTKICS